MKIPKYKSLSVILLAIVAFSVWADEPDASAAQNAIDQAKAQISAYADKLKISQSQTPETPSTDPKDVKPVLLEGLSWQLEGMQRVLDQAIEVEVRGSHRAAVILAQQAGTNANIASRQLEELIAHPTGH